LPCITGGTVIFDLGEQLLQLATKVTNSLLLLRNDQLAGIDLRYVLIWEIGQHDPSGARDTLLLKKYNYTRPELEGLLIHIQAMK
jgi:hypothetical protein